MAHVSPSTESPSTPIQPLDDFPEVLRPGYGGKLQDVQLTDFPSKGRPEFDGYDVQNELISRKRRVCGLRLITFFLLVALGVAMGLMIALAAVAGSRADRETPKHGSTAYAHTIQTTHTTTTTFTTSTVMYDSTPTSDCQASADEQWYGAGSGIAYSRICNSYIDPNIQDRTPLLQAPQSAFDVCIAICDSYNDLSNTTTVTAAVWNWAGQDNIISGMCNCVHLPSDYVLSSSSGQDTALRTGTSDEDSIPAESRFVRH